MNKKKLIVSVVVISILLLYAGIVLGISIAAFGGFSLLVAMHSLIAILLIKEVPNDLYSLNIFFVTAVFLGISLHFLQLVI